MKIGIDAKWFFNGPPSGKVVVRQLLEELFKRDYQDHEFYVFLSKSDKRLDFPYKQGNIVTVYVQNINNLVSNAVILPLYAKKYCLDIVLFQNFGTFFKIKNIVYIHDLLFLDYFQFYSLKERLYLSLIKPLAKRADAIITISLSEKERILKHKLSSRENVYFVYHGVDKKFKPIKGQNISLVKLLKRKYGLPNEFVLYLGRLNIRKNIKNLITAMQFVDVPLVVVGKVDHKSEDLMAHIENLNLKDKIIFTGFMEEEELPLVYAMATLFCFPSYAEGFGLPPLEAMASGTPVVVSDRTALPEICYDAAVYINPDSPLDISEKINAVMACDKTVNNLRRKGIKHSKSFTWDKSAKEIMNILKVINDI